MNTNQTTKAEELAKPLGYVFLHPMARGDWSMTHLMSFTTATNAGCKDVRPVYLEPPAPAVPDGWKLVPEKMYLDRGDLESLIYQAGIELTEDQVRSMTDVVLFVGDVAGDTPEENTHGLHAACAECVEEGFLPVVEFDYAPASEHPRSIPDVDAMAEADASQQPNQFEQKRSDIERDMQRGARLTEHKFSIDKPPTVSDADFVRIYDAGHDDAMKARAASDDRDEQIAELRRQVFSYESMVADRDELLAKQWQPIETAPRDGGVIIVRGGQNVSIGWWYGVGLNAWLPHNCAPTHWMPLPKPPIDTMREGGGVMDARDRFERHFPIPENCMRAGDGYAATRFDAWKAHDYEQVWKGWSACNAFYSTTVPEQSFDKRDTFMELVLDAVTEAKVAMKKFPQPNYVAMKIAEESGEVIRGAVHLAEGRASAQHVADEMRQLMAMLYRLWTEGDQVNGVPAIGGE